MAVVSPAHQALADARELRHSAARTALARQWGLARQGRSMLYPFIGRSQRFVAGQHYPRQDALDLSGRWQFYFHAHEPASAHAVAGLQEVAHPQEHGHIHLFRRDAQARLSHVAGLSLDARGLPLTWFSTNQWVTGEHWRAARVLSSGLAEMELRLHGPLAGVALWLAALVRLYAAPLQALLQARDQAVAQHCAQHHLTPASARADRRVALWSRSALSWPQDALQLVS